MDPANPLPAAPADVADGLPPVVFSALLEAADQAYDRDFPELIRTHPGWWVAYYGPERVALARTHTQVRQLCRSRPLDWSQLLITCIEVEPEYDFIGMAPHQEPQ